MEKIDIGIVGAGIIGLAIANRLASNYSVVVLEKESSFGKHTSSRNSEVIHSGIYYEPGSLKAKLCARGNELLYNFLETHNIKHKRCGKIILDSPGGNLSLLSLLLRAKDNWVDGFLIGPAEISRREPSLNFRAKGGMFIPSTGIFDSHTTMKQLAYLAELKGAMIAYNTSVLNIEKCFNEYIVTTNDFEFKANKIINSAGLWAHKIANMVGVKYDVQYCKGEYYKTTKVKNMNHLIYPLPTEHSLGIHTKMDLEGNISFGPSAFFVDKIDYNVDNGDKDFFCNEIKNFLDIKSEDLIEDFAGIRPKLKNSKDFVIQEDLPGFINLIGIESPGLTCCLSIAEYIEGMIQSC